MKKKTDKDLDEDDKVSNANAVLGTISITVLEANFLRVLENTKMPRGEMSTEIGAIVDTMVGQVKPTDMVACIWPAVQKALGAE